MIARKLIAASLFVALTSGAAFAQAQQPTTTTNPLKPAGVAELAFDILRGKLRENADVTEMTGTEVELHFPKVDRAINCVIDGELLPMDRDVSIRLHPGELKVMVPKVQAESMATTEPAAA